MFEIVAVGATAITFEFRMPVALTRLRRLSQSSVDERSIATPPLASARISIESIGRMPWLQSEPLNDGYRPRSAARSTDAEIAWYAMASMVVAAEGTASADATA